MPDRSNKPVGLTKDAGFQIGARKTFPVTPEKAWDFLVSVKGTRLWLDTMDLNKIEIKTEFVTPNGYFGKITVFKPYSHLRMQWKHPDWENISILQIRTIPAKEKTTISFHQEKLASADQREAMKSLWKSVVESLEDAF